MTRHRDETLAARGAGGGPRRVTSAADRRARQACAATPLSLPHSDHEGYLIKELQQRLRTQIEARIRAKGLWMSFPHSVVLMSLQENPGLSGAQLARRNSVTAQTMNGLLMPLETKGLIERRPDPENARILKCYLKPLGWHGFTDGAESGIYSVAPLARLNAADGMATPLAQEAYEELYATLGGKPVHHTLANHWARVVELLYATERLKELADDPELVDPNVRTLPTATPREGVGVVEAPRGTLYHHYVTDDRGIVEQANLIVATQNNSARMAMSVEKAAKGLISKGNVSEGILNKVEMAFRAYDPCFGCATHTLFGEMPLEITVRQKDSGEVLNTVKRFV